MGPNNQMMPVEGTLGHFDSRLEDFGNLLRGLASNGESRLHSAEPWLSVTTTPSQTCFIASTPDGMKSVIDIPAAGFHVEELTIKRDAGHLRVTGRHALGAPDGMTRVTGPSAFSLDASFTIPPKAKVVAATLKDGMLRISLESEPEKAASDTIPIRQG